MEMIYIVGAAILLFLGGSFLFQQKKTHADYIVIAWIFLAFFTLISNYLVETSGFNANVRFLQIISGTQLLHAPLLYFYVVTLLDKNFIFTRKSLIHFIPVFLFYLIHQPEFSKFIGFSSCSTHYSCYLVNKPCSVVFNTSKLILNTFYLTFTLFTFLELLKRKERITYQQKLDREWIKVLLTVGFIVNFMTIVVKVSHISRVEFFSSKLFLLNLVSTIFIILLCFVYLNFRGIVHFAAKLSNLFKRVKIQSTGLAEVIKQDDTTSGEAADFTLPQDQLEKYQRIILQYIEEKKPYLDHHLTKEKFSKKLSIPQHHLSVVLKICFQKSFTDFINSYRLQALIEKLEKSQNDTFTLLGLAYDCGFNSKSTFNRFFKTQMGVTPSEWVKATHLSNNIENVE